MKILIFTLAFICIKGIGVAQEKGVQFQQNLSWEQIKAQAKAEKKYIFMDVYATWCGPCKEMDKSVYTSSNLGDYMKDKFIAVKIQMDQTKADDQILKARYTDAKQIVSNYKINVFPSLLVFSSDGKLVSKTSGFVNEDQLISLLNKSLEKKNPYYEKLEQFKRGKLSPEEMNNLVQLAKSFEEKETAQKVAEHYIEDYLLRLPEKQLFTLENLNFIGEFLGNKHSSAYKFFFENFDKINEVLGEYRAQEKIMDFIDKQYLPQGNFTAINKPNWDLLEQNLVKEFGKLGQERLYGQRMLYYLANKEWKEFSVYYTKYFRMALKHSRYHLNNMSWAIFMNIDDVKILQLAVDVMRYSLENGDQNNVEAYDTYANLLYKTGRRDDAIKWEESAVKLSNEGDVFVQTLEKMKNNIKTWN